MIKKVVIGAVAVVLVAGIGLSVFARDTMMLAVAPKFHIANVVEKTLEVLEKETKAMGDAINGAKINPKESFTFEVGGGREEAFANLGVYYNKDEQRFIIEGAYSDGIEPQYANIYIDDKEIGLNIASFFAEYWVTSSKEFGNRFNKSIFGDEADIPEGLDISASNIQKVAELLNDEGLTDETTKAIRQTGIELLRETDFETQNVSVIVGGKEKSAKEVSLTISGERLRTFAIDLIDIYYADANVKKKFELLKELSAGAIDLGEYDMEKAIEEQKDAVYITSDINIIFTVRGGKAVAFEVKTSEHNDVWESTTETSFKISFNGAQYMIDDITIETRSIEIPDSKEGEAEEGNTSTMIYRAFGNHIPKAGIFSSEIVFETAYTYANWEPDNYKGKGNLEIDLNNKVNNIKCKFEGDGSEFEFTGDYDNSNGLELALIFEGYTLSVKYIKGDSGKKIQDLQRVYPFEMSQEQWDEYVKNNEKLDAIFNGNSYYDYDDYDDVPPWDGWDCGCDDLDCDHYPE